MKKCIAMAAVVAVVSGASAADLNLSSPDGRNTIRFEKDGKELTYKVDIDGKPAVLPSRAGLEIDNWVWEMALGKRTLEQAASWMDLLTVDSVTVHAPVDSVWTPLYGERSTVRDHFNSATLHMSRKDKSDYRLDVQVRAYDEGLAFRYFFPEHPAAIFHKVVGDLTDYTLPEGTMAWSEKWAQSTFDYTPIDSLTRPVERALTMELPDGKWLALLDADVDDWCLTKFKARDGKPGTLESVMYSPVDIVTYYATPWKIIMTADTPGELIENNDIVLNLNPRSEGDFSWVKPGKIMRSTVMTTEGGLRTIDFCAEHNIPYMLYDWLWYVPCTSHDGDATKVVDKVDMAKVIAHGKEKGVGVWLYVNQHALMKQMDELFPLLRQWGVVGVKSGFVQYASHRWATWLHDMVRKAADNRLQMNIHDEFRPSGFSRTYPNLLTQEGICGNEEFPDATRSFRLPACSTARLTTPSATTTSGCAILMLISWLHRLYSTARYRRYYGMTSPTHTRASLKSSGSKISRPYSMTRVCFRGVPERALPWHAAKAPHGGRPLLPITTADARPSIFLSLIRAKSTKRQYTPTAAKK